MNISKAFKEEKIMKALTGVGIEEFYRMANSFQWAMWSFYINQNRNIPLENTRILGHIHMKLLFILFCIRFNPAASVVALLFRIPHRQVPSWITKLAPYIKQISHKNISSIRRKTTSIEELISAAPEIKELIRSISRNRGHV